MILTPLRVPAASKLRWYKVFLDSKPEVYRAYVVRGRGVKNFTGLIARAKSGNMWFAQSYAYFCDYFRRRCDAKREVELRFFGGGRRDPKYVHPRAIKKQRVEEFCALWDRYVYVRGPRR